MNVAEDLVRRSLLAHESDAPDESPLLASVGAGIARRRRVQWVSVTGVAAAVVAVIMAATLVVHGSSDSRGPAVPASSAVPVPAGMQPVSYRGVTVFVPASWKINATHCGTALQDTVIVETGHHECLSGPANTPGIGRRAASPHPRLPRPGAGTPST